MKHRIISGSTHGLADVEAFIDLVNHLDAQSKSHLRGRFDGDRPVYVTRAPGRLDVMGGIADYSGSLVLQRPIREATHIALQRRRDRQLRIVTLSEGATGRSPQFEMNLADFEKDRAPTDYNGARAFFDGDPSHDWAAYAAGAFLVLTREKECRFDEGATILIHSDVPEGKGVSSSAALEVATMQAIAAAFRLVIEPRELAILCQKVENLVVGAPCGVMDQMTAACGRSDALLALLCQPAELKEPVPIPAEITFWGIDSGIRHAVSGSDYMSVRVGAFMGYRMIAEWAGLNVTPADQPGIVSIDDPTWRNSLANLGPDEFRQRFFDRLPETIDGRSFLDRYRGTADRVTKIDPSRVYAVRYPTAHPVFEHDRVTRFASLLKGPLGHGDRARLGELMLESHASYAACGLGSDGTDQLVELVREAGPEAGLYGARITGGGSGGAVAIIGDVDAGTVVHDIARRYGEETGRDPYVFTGSSPGSAAFGHIVLQCE